MLFIKNKQNMGNATQIIHQYPLDVIFQYSLYLISYSILYLGYVLIKTVVSNCNVLIYNIREQIWVTLFIIITITSCTSSRIIKGILVTHTIPWHFPRADLIEMHYDCFWVEPLFLLFLNFACINHTVSQRQLCKGLITSLKFCEAITSLYNHPCRVRSDSTQNFLLKGTFPYFVLHCRQCHPNTSWS